MNKIREENTLIKKDLIETLRSSVQKAMKEDAKLLERGCSERAIVHWLATYFLEAAQKVLTVPSPTAFFDHQDGYTVDVEYNRIGSEGESKHLYEQSDRCNGCDVTEQCIRKPSGRQNDSIMIDMVFHSRSSNKSNQLNPYRDNLLCVEVKTATSTKAERECDEERIKILVDRENITKESTKALKEPKYILGATVYFESPDKAVIKLFDGSEKPIEITVCK